ncbi:MAG: tetratricopeptide repeat protein [Melioribacteraceae bacterium]|nr:tetratricopeptide repeat protein [Melioribacteraceae bacterium]
MSEINKLYETARNLFVDGNIAEAKKIIDNLPLESLNIDFLLLASQIHITASDYNLAEKTLEIIYYQNNSNLEINLALALSYKKNNKLEEAIKLYKSIINDFPNSYEAYYNYAILLFENEVYVEAIILFQKSVEINATFELAYYNMGNSYRKLENYSEAEKAFKKALELNPTFEDAVYNLGVVKENQLKFSEALTCYEKAISLNPDNVEAHWNRAILLLLTGNYNEGWEEYEWRLKKAEFARSDFVNEKWNGEDLNGKRIIVYSEQGIGDLFQFIRYLKLLKSEGAFVILECKKFLFPFFENLNYVDLLVSKEDRKPEYHYYIPLFSLLKYFPDNFVNEPYLKVDSLLTKKWEEYFSKFNEFKIGIAWQGNRNHKDDKYRSCSFDQFKKILNLKNVQLFSLQKLSETDLTNNELEKLGVINLDNDFPNTAAIIANLDLVISVDTSITHLAGALGKEVWTLLSAKPDWRWQLEKSVTEWYPAMKLHRQKKLGDYDGVFDMIIKNLNFNLNTSVVNDWQTIYESGLLLFNNGNIAEAIKEIEKAIELNPDNPVIKNNLGLIYQQNSELELAEKCFKESIEIDKSYVQAYSNLAIIKAGKNNYTEAELILLDALKIDASDPELNYNLGITYYAKRKNLQAIDCFEKALHANSKYKDAYYNLALVLLSEDRVDEAETVIVKAEASGVESADLDFIKGNICKVRENYDKAIEYYLKSIEVNNSNIDSYINLGSAYFLNGMFDEAVTLYNEMINYNIHDERIYYSLGVINHELGKLNEAEILLNKAIQINPNNYEQHLGLAEVHLTKGNYKRGFEEYEWRLKRAEYSNRKIKMPDSVNELRNKKVYVFSEQGFGDIINFVFYLDELTKLNTKIIFETRPELLNFFKSNFPFMENIAEPIEVEADYTIPLLSLPRLFFSSFNKLFFERRLLNASPLNTGKWKTEFEKELKLKIGIVWKGKSYPVHNRKRHTELENFKSIANLNNVQLYSLQIGAEQELDDVNWLNPISNKINDFNDTASIITCMDLIITIDSAVAHLAGAMGKETWLLLAFMPDWRWLLEKGNTEWYSSVKIFRQKERGNWDRVFGKVLDSLKEKLSNNE